MHKNYIFIDVENIIKIAVDSFSKNLAENNVHNYTFDAKKTAKNKFIKNVPNKFINIINGFDNPKTFAFCHKIFINSHIGLENALIKANCNLLLSKEIDANGRPLHNSADNLLIHELRKIINYNLSIKNKIDIILLTSDTDIILYATNEFVNNEYINFKIITQKNRTSPYLESYLINRHNNIKTIDNIKLLSFNFTSYILDHQKLMFNSQIENKKTINKKNITWKLWSPINEDFKK